MMSLGAALATMERAGDAYRFPTSDAWAQGRTLFGGMNAALCHAAAGRSHPDLPPLRSAQFIFAGPAVGELHFTPRLLRRGRSSAMVSVECRAEEGVAVMASLIFGTARESQIAHAAAPAPEMPVPDACPPFHKTQKPLPGFLSRFEYRHAAGSRLFEPGREPGFTVWTRFRDPPEGDPVAALLALADALPCAAMASFPAPAPVSTMSWAIDLHHHPNAMDGWHLLSSVCESAADGYSQQVMRVFDATGQPLATGRQMVALYI